MDKIIKTNRLISLLNFSYYEVEKLILFKVNVMLRFGFKFSEVSSLMALTLI